MSSRTTLRRFQRDAINEGAAPLRECLELVRQARLKGMPEECAELARQLQGGLLINAPTGIGKTLIAGGIAQDLSVGRKVVWMWFAPFTGIVEQTIAVVGREFPGLRPMRPALERNPGQLRTGDVFVTTWAGVASRKKEARQIRREREDMPSLDRLLECARDLDFEVGAVIDEAHHAFRPGTAAFDFCRKVLRPTVSIMVTATPREAEIKNLTEALGVKKHSTIAVSREQGVEDHLLKRGVKAALFRARPSASETVDFKRLALREAVNEHRTVKDALEKAGIEVSPLLLVQAGEEKNSPQKAKRTLEEFGMPSDGIRIHTADEPDEEFLRIAEDESAEALIFKMAAATGFDAPRAFVLASLRRIQDANFGVQIVGRIMRKHRAHQDACRKGKKPPEYLDYGYVFLADHESQKGLIQAAALINTTLNAINTLTNNASVVYVGDNPEIQDVTKGASIFSQLRGADLKADDGESEDSPEDSPEERPLPSGEQEPLPIDETGDRPVAPDTPQGKKRILPDGRDVEVYDSEPPPPMLRADLHPPKRLLCSEFNAEKGETVTRDVVDRFMLDDPFMSLANKRMEEVCIETMDIFASVPLERRVIQADLALSELDRMAQSRLAFEADAFGYLQLREFKRLFMARLRGLATQEGWIVDDKFIREWMMKILALRPKALRRAISQVVGANVISKDAEDLPRQLDAVGPLSQSSLNIYGVYPPKMNSWEENFAQMLDADTKGIVRWWHRNPARKSWSAKVLVPGFGEYFPDFAVGVNGRAAGDGILLVETKREINDKEGRAAAKTRTKHPRYGRVMMLWLDKDSGEWHLVEPANGEGNKTIPGFHLGMMRGY